MKKIIIISVMLVLTTLLFSQVNEKISAVKTDSLLKKQSKGAKDIFSQVNVALPSFSDEDIEKLDFDNVKKMVREKYDVHIAFAPLAAFSRGQEGKGTFQPGADITGFCNLTNRVALGVGTGYFTTISNTRVISTIFYGAFRYRFNLDYETTSIPYFLFRYGVSYNKGNANSADLNVRNSMIASIILGAVMNNNYTFELSFNYFDTTLIKVKPAIDTNSTQSIGVAFGYNFM